MRKLLAGSCVALALAWSLPALAAPQQTIVGPNGTAAQVDSHGLQVDCTNGCSGGGGGGNVTIVGPLGRSADASSVSTALSTEDVAALGSPSNFTPAQVSVANTATLIAALRANRRSITVVNTGTTAVYLGPTSGVTTSNGALLPGVLGASITLPYTGAVYGIAATGSETVTEHELY